MGVEIGVMEVSEQLEEWNYGSRGLSVGLVFQALILRCSSPLSIEPPSGVHVL
jgi:hypothetical protein